MIEHDFNGLSDAVVQTIREPLLILDSGFRIRAANPAFCRSFRVDASETVGSSLFELGNGQWDIPALRDLLEEVVPRNVSVEDFEVDHDFPHIGRRFMRLNARRLEREDEADELILLAIQDATAQKQLEDDLLRSNQELERFAYVASHDLQEPLRMVASYTGLLAQRYEGQLDERADKYIRYAVDGAERMKALIQDLLAYSRVGTQGVEPTPTEPGEALDRVLRDYQMAIQESGAQVTREPLPRVLADPSQLRQVFQNLIGNALKFSGDAPPEVHVSGDRDGDQVVLSVEDHGIGIDPVYFDRIFVIFQRLHGRETDGTGIGLALSKRIVERNGGRLWVESAPGEGATFHFTLPSGDA